MPLTWAERISTRLRPKVIGPRAGRPASRMATSENADRGGVGEHVGGVGEQRQRVGEDAGDDLGRHEGEDQRERDRQSLPRSASAEAPWVWPRGGSSGHRKSRER